MLKALVVITAVMAPAVASVQPGDDSVGIATACAGGAVISAITKYRDAAKADTKNTIAVADAVIAAVAGILVGWFGHKTAVGILAKFIGSEVSAPLAALVMSLLGIKIIELVMTADLSKFSIGAKKNV
jgi:uncharacterized membrane-anchored protein